MPIILLVASLFALPLNMSFLKESPLSLRRVWDAPSYVCPAPDGGMIVVDKSKTRVSILDEEQRVCAAIHGGVTTEDSFYYAEYTATDGKSIFIADVTHLPNSNRVERERILEFSMEGKYLQTVWECEYEKDDMPLQLGTVRGLSACAGSVFFPRLQGESFSLCSVDESGKENVRSINVRGERVCYAAYDPITQTTAFSTMQGSLIADRNGAQERFACGDGINVLQGVAVDNKGGVYAADLSAQRVIKAVHSSDETLYSGDWIQFLAASPSHLGFHDDGKVCLTTLDGSIIYASDMAPFAPGYDARVIIAWLLALYLGVCVLALFIYVIYISGKSGKTKRERRTVAFILMIMLTAFSVGGYIIYSFNKTLTENSMDELKRSALYLSSISSKTYGDAFSRLDELRDYDNGDYRLVRSYLDAFCSESFENGLNSYYILLKFDAAKNELWGVMDYENTNGVVYPYQPYEGSGYDMVEKSGEPVSVQDERNAYGLWSYVIVPVFDPQGNTVGLLEVGANTYSQQEAQRELVLRVGWTTFSALMMALLSYNEFIAYRKQLRIRSDRRREGNTEPVLGFLRIIIFLTFLGDNLDAAFVPQISERLFMNMGLNTNTSLAAALPMSAQLFAIAIASLFGGAIIDRHGVRKIMLYGGALRIASTVLMLFAVTIRSFALFTFAKLLGGFGSGTLVVGCNTLPSCTNDETERTSLFAGLNIGVMAGVVLGASTGGYLAQYIGRSACYAAVVISSILCACACFAYIGKNCKSTTPGAVSGGRAVSDFLKKPAVFGFLLFILFPFMVMGYFKDYIFPLYASGLGYGEADIGNVLLIGGILAIYLGELLPERLFVRLGIRRAMTLANIIYIGALLLFVTQQSYAAAVAAICVLSLGSFGMTAQGVYIADVTEREKLPAGASMGIYGFTDNMGQTGGPLILGTLLPLGYGVAMGVVVAAGTALLIAFKFLTRKTNY